MRSYAPVYAVTGRYKPMRWAVPFIFVACAVFTHRRGKMRHRCFRQLSDHSAFTAPINCFAYAFATVPNTSHIDKGHFPALAILKREWRTFRDEALALRDERRTKAAGECDAFFRKG